VIPIERIERIEHCTAIFRKVHRALRAFDGVRHVDVGYRFCDGVRTNRLAFRLFVPKKRVKHVKSVRLAPKTLEGMPIDVIACGMMPHLGPVLGGAFICERGQGGGTLGAVFSAQDGSGGRLGLTARHVCPDKGATVLLGSRAQSSIGTVSQINFDLGASAIALESDVDASVGSLGSLGGVTGFATIGDVNAALAGHTRVRKNGATTGVTSAQVTGFNAVDETVTMSAVPGSSAPVVIAAGGDSGAFWVDSSGSIIALHVQGDGAHAVGMFAGPIQSAFAVAL
jgi:hypothetical protein